MTLIILLITTGISIAAFMKPYLYDKMLFAPYLVHHKNEYHRFITSGVIHGDWIHLFINMLVFYSFGRVVESYYGYYFGEYANLHYLMLYLGALIFSDVSTYAKNRNNPNYRSLGASGAVSAVVFASILFEPFSTILLMFFLPLPAIVMGVLYLAVSAYLARQGHGPINHEAHFYGAIFGLVYTIAFKPSIGLNFLKQLGLW